MSQTHTRNDVERIKENRNSASLEKQEIHLPM